MAIINFNSISGVSTISVASSITVGNVAITSTTITAPTFTGNLTGNVNSTGVTTVTTLNATTITGVSTIGVTTVTATTLTVNGNAYPSSGPLSNRNIVINGSMIVNQRGTVTGVTGDTYGGPDRYKCFIGSAGTWTLSQATDAPTGIGLSYSYKFQCTSTGTLSSGSYLGHRMILEGYDSARLNGQSFTVSFWVKCKKAGTMTCEPYDSSSGATQSVSKQFTINAADTWEYKSITFPANPRNYPSDNAQALILHWWLSAGSSWKSVASTGQWTNFNNGFRAYGCDIDLTDSTNNYFQITGIQLESGTVATPFEHRSYGQELALCQRYCHVTSYDSVTNPIVFWGYWSTSTIFEGFTTFPVTMRTSPTLTIPTIGSLYALEAQVAWRQISSFSANESGPNCAKYAFTAATNASFTKGQGGAVGIRAAGTVQFSSEL